MRSTLTVLGSIVLAVFSLVSIHHLFSVPEACRCTAPIDATLMADTKLAGNSVFDANWLSILIGGYNMADLCYSRKPQEGRTFSVAGVSSKGCEVQNKYHVRHDIQYDYKSDVKTMLSVELEEAQPLVGAIKAQKANGFVYLDRSSSACRVGDKCLIAKA
jgi:hypothetical protein